MRVLVVANETCASPTVVREVRELVRAADEAAEVMVVAPARSASRLSHWTGSDRPRAIADAERRLIASTRALLMAGVPATGVVGDADPLQALDDAVRVFRPDAILIATHPADRSAWQRRWVVEMARERMDVPVTHVAVDLDRERAGLPDAATVRRPRPEPRSRPHEVMRLHARLGYDDALAVPTTGFRDARHEERSGVLTLTTPGGDDDRVLVAIDVPVSAVARFEVAPDAGGGRRFVVPAAVLNRLGLATRLDEDAIE